MTNRHFNPGISKDNKMSLDSFRTPGFALEHRQVTSASVTFTTALAHDILYTVVSLGGPTLISLNGSNPSQVTGSNINVGIPVPANGCFTFCPISGVQTQLRATALVSGSATSGGGGGYGGMGGGNLGANTTNLFLYLTYPTGSIAGI